tara:strand:- start:1313 stop:2053 length:741 start_codon:yes stop_codon:yes gene_type:complete
MKTSAIIEARMGSNRLPGKVLMQAAKKPMLEHLINRLKKVKTIDEIILATSENTKDDILIEFANKNKIKYFRGSENDVLSRVLNAGKHYDVEDIVGITGDCPIIDPNIVEQVISIYKNNDVSFVTNALVRSFPDGMDAIIYNLSTLKKSSDLAKTKKEREHTTLNMNSNPKIFSYINLVSPPELHWPELGLTLDEEEDYIFLKKIIEHFEVKNPFFTCSDVIKLIKANPELQMINNNVKRTNILKI